MDNPAQVCCSICNNRARKKVNETNLTLHGVRNSTKINIYAGADNVASPGAYYNSPGQCLSGYMQEAFARGFQYFRANCEIAGTRYVLMKKKRQKKTNLQNPRLCLEFISLSKYHAIKLIHYTRE